METENWFKQYFRSSVEGCGDSLSKRISRASQVALVVKKPPANAGEVGDTGSIPGWGRSPGGGHGTRSSILAWRIPWTEEPGGLQSIGWQRVGHD